MQFVETTIFILIIITKIEQVRSYQYLGILFTVTVVFLQFYNMVAKYGVLSFITSKKPDANILKQNMFKDTNIMEKLHIRFCKQILGIHSNSSNHACRAELGQVHFAYNIYCNVIKYWNCLCSINKDCLVKEALYLNFKIASKGKVTWISSVKYILQSINESMIISKIYYMHTIKKKLKRFISRPVL